MKRSQPDSSAVADSSTTKKRRTIAGKNGPKQSDQQADSSPTVSQTPEATPSRNSRSQKGSVITKAGPVTNGFHDAPLEDEEEGGSPTPTGAADTVFRTPQKSTVAGKPTATTPSRSKRADKSAKRKSANALLARDDEEDWEGENALAQEILDDDEELVDGLDVLGQAETPSKKGRGRPKGSKNRRSPTPEGDLPPEERYFFQNRAGPPHISNSTLASLKLLTHDEYFDHIRKYNDPHEPERQYLMKLHARSFLQWQFELGEGYNICLYGWGSKRPLVTKFAEWLYPKHNPPPKIVVVNGYTPKLNIRTVLSTLITAVTPDKTLVRVVGQPDEILDSLLADLTATHPPSSRVIVMINSIDAPSLRRPAIQALLARLAAHPSVNVVATADTPSFALMWNGTLRTKFNFVFHDCTTYAPYDAELSVVDDVHDLLGRKGRRIGGKEGVGFVLKSLPENARNLYRVLLTEILAVVADGVDDETAKEREERGEEPRPNAKGRESDEQIGIDQRLLYQKASEEFICSSEMNFRTLLKEFHDHEMILSRRDASGTELLSVPLGREDMEGVLEDLVLA